jgi:hypothetical protein
MKKPLYFALPALLALAGANLALADDPPPADDTPRTHVDTTVVGDANTEEAKAPDGDAALNNDHHFVAGAPELVAMTDALHLSARQKTQLNDIIENSDAAAVELIKRERNLSQMLAATTPQDPLYAQLQAEQATSAAKWQASRDVLQQNVMAILTPAQQSKLEQLQATQHSRPQTERNGVAPESAAAAPTHQ